MISLLSELLKRLSWRVLISWLLMAGGVWLFAELAADAYRGQGFAFDDAVLRWFYERRSALVTRLLYGVSVVGDVPATVAASLVVALLLARLVRREVLFFALAMGGATLIMVVTKIWIGRERPSLFPDGAIYPTASPSFPSGHATGSAALYLALFLIIRRHAPRWAWPTALIGGAMTLAIAASRLYLGVHFPSDVLAGLALGAAWVLVVNALYHRDRSGRYLLVRLPVPLSERLDRRVAAAPETEDELVAAALEHYLERDGGGHEKGSVRSGQSPER